MDEEIESNSSNRWLFCSQKFPQTQIIFLLQVALIYIIVIASVVNLSVGTPDRELWIALLGSCLGYLLPSPTISR